jgi:hypothetical protein
MAEFDTQLTKLIAAELYVGLSIAVARELFGKSYFALGMAEKAAVGTAFYIPAVVVLPLPVAHALVFRLLLSSPRAA